MGATRIGLALGALSLLLVILIYTPGVQGPWVLDDQSNLVENSLLRIDGSTLDEWRTAALSSSSGIFHRPIAMLSFALNHALEGALESSKVKAWNIGIHGLTAVAIFFFVRLLPFDASGRLSTGEARHSCVGLRSSFLVDRNALAIVAAFLWVASPLHVSTVLYAVQRMAQLSTLFVILGLLLFAHYRNRWASVGASAGEVVAAGLWILAVAVLAVLSKENGALLLWLIVVVEVCCYQGRWAGRRRARLQCGAVMALIAPIVIVSLWFFAYPDSFLQGYENRNFSLQERLLTQPRVLWQYVRWLLLPSIDGMGLFHDDIPLSTSWLTPWTTFAGLTAWVVLFAVGVVLRKRFPVLLFALLFFLVAHSIESSLLPLEMAFEHRNYLPSVGLSILVSWCILALYHSLSGRSSVLPVVILVIVVSLPLGLLFIRVATWSDSVRLAQVTAVNHPASARANAFYAKTLINLAQAEEGKSSETENRDSFLLEARNYYELMHLADTSDLGALVMMYQMDSQYFSSANRTDESLMLIQKLIDERQFGVSDINALEVLIRCLGKKVCIGGQSVASDLLNSLKTRFPESQQIALLEYEYLLATQASLQQRITVLESIAGSYPLSLRLYKYLASAYGEAGDVGRIVELTREYMEVDIHRRHLPIVQAVFASGDEAKE